MAAEDVGSGHAGGAPRSVGAAADDADADDGGGVRDEDVEGAGDVGAPDDVDGPDAGVRDDDASVDDAGVRDDEIELVAAGAVAGRVETGVPNDVAVGFAVAGAVAGRDDTGVPNDVAVELVVELAGVPDAGVPDDGVPDGVPDDAVGFAAVGEIAARGDDAALAIGRDDAAPDEKPDAGVPDDGVPDGVAAAGDVDGRAALAAGEVAGRVVVFVVARAAAGVPAGGVARDGVVAVVPAGGVAVRRAAARASAVVMPPLELVLPIAPSTDAIGDDGGSSTGSGVSGRAAPNAVGESGFTPPVPARGIGC